MLINVLVNLIDSFKFFCLFNVGTPSGVHLFDLLLWSIFQSSIFPHYIVQFFKGAGETGSMFAVSYKVRWYVHIWTDRHSAYVTTELCRYYFVPKSINFTRP